MTITKTLRRFVWKRCRNSSAVLLAACISLLSGCATNPVTGKSDFVLMSEQQEIALGRKYNAELLTQARLVEDPALQSYVQQIGEQLGANSHRPNLIYRFSVLDSADVNAFALPGGYIYITRGLLAYLNSEAELAAVLGHEIGHVTARHSVRQHSAATATGILGAVAAAAAGVYGAGDMANVLGTALVRGYGREHELEADRLGAEYLARTSYAPGAMVNVIEVLKNQEIFEKKLAREEGREPRSYHGVFSSHPSNDRRLLEVVDAAGVLQGTGTSRIGRDNYLNKIDGLVFGDSEKDGVRRGRNFYHAALDFSLAFPRGWRIENRPDRLLAIAPRNSAQLFISLQDLNRRMSPEEFLIRRLGVKNLRNGEAIREGDLQGYTGLSEVRTSYGYRPARFVVLYHGKQALIFTGFAKDEHNPLQYDREFLATAESFHRLTKHERSLARSKRVKIVKADSGTRFKVLATQSPLSHHPEEQLRLLNAMYSGGEPRAGAQIKIVR